MHYEYMVGVLSRDNNHSLNKIVSKDDYEKFCSDYVWMALRGEHFGKQFCYRFKIDDYYLLSTPRGVSACKQHIENMAYVK